MSDDREYRAGSPSWAALESANYQTQVALLTEWYTQRLPVLGKIHLTRREYQDGTDNLKGLHKQLAQAAFVEWLTMHNYELSYNQCCVAFFTAANNLGLLKVEE